MFAGPRDLSSREGFNWFSHSVYAQTATPAAKPVQKTEAKPAQKMETAKSDTSKVKKASAKKGKKAPVKKADAAAPAMK